MKIQRKRWAGLGVAVAVGLTMSGCVATGGSNPGGSSGPDADGPIVVQSRFAGVEEEGFAGLVDSFNGVGGGEAEVNSVPGETYRSQLPTYLSSSNPPDVFTWLAGQSTNEFADQGLALDVSDVWSNLSNYPEALRTLSQDSAGTPTFVPTNYYWWGMYYKKSVFEDLGLTAPTTWEEFLQVSEDIESAGIIPIGLGVSDAPWYLPGWFDYINVRTNGGEYHLELLKGERSYDDPEVKETFKHWAEVLPYFDPDASGVSFQQGITNFAEGKTAMILAPANISVTVPADVRDDLAFFQFPIIDPSIPIVEEAPTDGLFASSRTTRPALTKEFLAYAASAEGQEVLLAGQGGTTLATNPDADLKLDELALQGKAMLESADQLTQFFDRDAGPSQLPPASAALGRFIVEPDAIDDILAEWQDASVRARANS